MHKSRAAGLLLGCLTALTPCLATAGPFAQDMAKCLIKSTSNADRTQLIQWIFISMATHPDLSSLSNVPEQTRAEINDSAGKLFARLLFDSCRSETALALQSEGPAALQYGFQVLGQVAMSGLMTDPHVTQAMAGLSKYVTPEKMRGLLKEAGKK